MNLLSVEILSLRKYSSSSISGAKNVSGERGGGGGGGEDSVSARFHVVC